MRRRWRQSTRRRSHKRAWGTRRPLVAHVVSLWRGERELQVPVPIGWHERLAVPPPRNVR